MRGNEQKQGAMFSYMTMEQRIPASHPIRRIRGLVDEALGTMDATFSAMYSERGRPSIAPERPLRAQLLMVLYSISGEQRLMEELNYNLLFRWFLGLEMANWSLSNLATMLRLNLFTYRDLRDWLHHPFGTPPNLPTAEQLQLAWA